MKRTVLFTLIISLASAPLALADGPILSSAKRQAQELVRTDANPSLAANSSSAAVVQDGGMVYDNTPSSRRVREDGCKWMCGDGTNNIGK